MCLKRQSIVKKQTERNALGNASGTAMNLRLAFVAIASLIHVHVCLAADDEPIDRKAIKVTALAIAPNSKLLASASTVNRDGRTDVVVHVWELPELKPKIEMSAEGKAVRSLDFSRDNSLLCGGSDDGVVHFWSTKEKKLVASSPRRDSPIKSVRFMRRDDRAVGVSDVFQLFDSTDAKVLKTSSSGAATDFADMQLNANGALLAVSSKKESVLLNPSTFAIVQHIANHRLPVTAQALSTSTELLLATGHKDGSIDLWHAGKGRLIRTLRDHEAAVAHLAFYDRNTKLVSLDAEGNLRYWDLEAGKRIQAATLMPASLFCISPDRTQLATSDGELIHVRLLDPTRPEQVASIKMNAPIGEIGTRDPDSPDLNLLKTWRIIRGDWKQTEKGFTGSGDSRIQSRTHFPSNMMFRFKMRVNGETNPRVRFDTFHFGYEGRKRRLFLHGPKATGEPVPFEPGEEIAVQIRIVDDHATLWINDKEVANSNPKPTTRRFIAIEGGGKQSRGSVELYDIELKEL